MENLVYQQTPRSVRQYSQLRRLLDGYDSGVRYADEAVGKVLDALRAKGVYDDLAIIITADHGENLANHVYSEHGTADEPTCHIPLIIKWPGVRPGSTDAGFHYLLDLAPTVADLLRLPHSPRWDG